MQFLKDTLGIDAHITGKADISGLPYMISDSYNIDNARLGAVNVSMVTPKNDNPGMQVLKKQLALIAARLQKPTVLVTNGLTARQRKSLIEVHKAFIVPGQQIYLPFLGVLLQERFAAPKRVAEKLSGLAQLVLIYCIEKHLSGFSIMDLADKLGYTKMSISRAVQELEQQKLVVTEKIGRTKHITFTAQGKDLYQKAEPLLESPVKKKVYVPKNAVGNLPVAGLTALSKLTMINDTDIVTVASGSLSTFKDIYTEDGIDGNDAVCVELWKYDPMILAQDGHVDILSLLLSFKDDEDERTEGEAEFLMNRFWEEYDGNGTR